MTISFPLEISAHAVEQFRQRIAPMSDTKARQFIMTGVRQAANVKLLPDGNTLRVRTRRPFPFEFRAYLVFDDQRKSWVVTTIVRGDSFVTRKQRRKSTQSDETAEDAKDSEANG